MTRRGQSAPHAPSDRAVVDLRILATTDLHAHLFPFDYYTDRRDNKVGLAQAASLVAELCGPKENCFLVDNGDTLQGAPLGDAAERRIVPEGRPHPMIAAMNAMRFDAATLGNHDFDYGLNFLETVLQQAGFPVALANATRADGSRFLPGHIVIERQVTDRAGRPHPLRIAVIGVAPPQIAKWHAASLSGLLIWEDMVQAVRRELATLSADPVDLTLVLAHSGLGQAEAQPGAENAALAIAALPGVDAVVAGHTHAVFPPSSPEGATAQPTPIVQPGFWGSHIGRIDIQLEQATADQSDRPWRITRTVAQAQPVQGRGPNANAPLRRSLRQNPALRRQMLQDHRLTRSYTARVLGRSDVALETYFSMIAPTPALDILAAAKSRAARTFIGSEPHLAGLPLIASVTPFKAGGRGGPSNFTDIPKGPLRLRNAADLYLYTNSLAVLRVTGADVRAWLERVASAFATLTPGAGAAQPQALMRPGFASYNFDVLYGLNYTFDLREAPLYSADGTPEHEGPGRVRDLCLADGTSLTDQAEVLITTNNYRGSGGGGFAAAARSETVIQTSDPVRDRVAEFISEADQPLRPKGQRVWRFAPLGGVPVVVETGPGALDHPDRIAALGLSDLGQNAAGFQRFQLSI